MIHTCSLFCWKVVSLERFKNTGTLLVTQSKSSAVYLLHHSAVIVDVNSEWLVLLSTLPFTSCCILILLDSVHKLQTKYSRKEVSRRLILSSPGPARVRSYLPAHSSHEHTPQSHRFLHLHTPEGWKRTQTTTATYRNFAHTFLLLHSALSVAACVVAARSKYWNTRYYICTALVYFLSRLQARGHAHVEIALA